MRDRSVHASVVKLAVLAALAAGCLGTDADEITDEVESASVPTAAQGAVGQGSTMQGSTMQGSTMQGSTMQGSTMQGSTMQGTWGGGAVSYAEVSGTALVFWRKTWNGWEQRFPNKICYWDRLRRTMSSCSKAAIGTPINGSTWPTTFTKADGQSVTVTLRIEAVRFDNTRAMFPLNGSSFANGSILGCENTDGCRVNSDIYNYDVRVVDVLDANGNPEWLCPAGQTAIPLAGRWEPTGEHVPSTTQFTFACTNGVIAKCTRWGYRPYDRAQRDNDPTPNNQVSLAPYHQACVRAAMADYCGNGKSMTKNGTLVDVFDYFSNNEMGFIPRLDGFVFTDHEYATAFVTESYFDALGATLIISPRYRELESDPAYNINETCAGRFVPGGAIITYQRTIPSQAPFVRIDSTPACAHSEFTIGKWLHPDCSVCSETALAHCNDPTDSRGWNQACVDAVRATNGCAENSTTWAHRVMSTHSECTTGPGLNKYDTGCTLQVCLSNPSCCNLGLTAWSQSCVNTANAQCRGGREGLFRGFCGTSLIAPPIDFELQ